MNLNTTFQNKMTLLLACEQGTVHVSAWSLRASAGVAPTFCGARACDGSPPPSGRAASVGMGQAPESLCGPCQRHLALRAGSVSSGTLAARRQLLNQV